MGIKGNWDRRVSRRGFLGIGGMSAAALALGSKGAAAQSNGGVARNRLNDSELAGCTFAPDGRTFFVNIQDPGLTFAIWGPFGRRDAGRRRQMASAAPPARVAPKISDELAHAAERHGMSPYEAAAFDRLGAPLA